MKRNQRAFTLVEVLAAMLFLAIAMPAIVSALLTSNRAANVSERIGIATQLGENRLGELMLGNEWSSASAAGDFGADYPGYRYDLAKSDWQNGAMTELTMNVYFQVQGAEHQVVLSTLVNENLTDGSGTTTTSGTTGTTGTGTTP